jgi:hypothetical protein
LKAPEEELYKLIQIPNSKYFKDSGKRLGDGNEKLTIVGFYPSNQMSHLMTAFKLL